MFLGKIVAKKFATGPKDHVQQQEMKLLQVRVARL